jgi:inosine-uridine nucleoside N-ribohydrolase
MNRIEMPENEDAVWLCGEIPVEPRHDGPRATRTQVHTLTDRSERRQVGITADDIARLAAGGRVARTFGGLLGFFRQRLSEIHGLSTASLHDPCALVPLIAPEMITYVNCPVEIELGNGVTRGMTVCDFRNLTSAKLENIRARSDANCQVAVSVDARILVDHIMEAILGWPQDEDRR